MTTIINMNIMRIAYLLCLGGIVAGLATANPSPVIAAANEAESSATNAVKGTINDLIQVLEDEALKQPQRAEERRHRIEDIIKHRVDYEEMARRALGAPWSTLSLQGRHDSSTSL